MKKIFQFIDADGRENTVEFEAVQDRAYCRQFGVRAQLSRAGKVLETAEAGARFITPEETSAVMDMLCEFQVTPCTLCDVI